MPYIKQNRIRAAKLPETPGELNYAITMLIMEYIDQHPAEYGYGLLNAVMGVLACVQQEMYRRVLIPYENQKCKENGDVY